MAFIPYSVLRGQVLLLIVSRLWAEYTLIQTSHDVLLHLVHDPLYRLRGAWRAEEAL